MSVATHGRSGDQCFALPTVLAFLLSASLPVAILFFCQDTPPICFRQPVERSPAFRVVISQHPLPEWTRGIFRRLSSCEAALPERTGGEEQAQQQLQLRLLSWRKRSTAPLPPSRTDQSP
jgi:hypothetical protein